MRYVTLLKMILPILLIFLNSSYSQAHKVRVFAWEEGGIIKTETQFSGGSGRAAKKAAITVISEQDKQELLSGTTDDQGFFSFPIPEAAKKNRYNLEIIANSGDGHKNSWHLSAADYLQIEENSVSQPPPPLLPVPPHQPIQLDQLNQHRVSACVLDEQQLTRIIESTLEKKLAPVKRSLAMQRETGPSLQDILGGIGYIFGLAGITAYFKSQKKKP